jgi:lipopolysaccharide export system permease protein
MLASLPYNANDFLEGACLLGVMIALGISHQEGNLNVLRSSGESPIKIVLISAIGPMILVFSYMGANELAFRDIHINAEVEKNLIINNQPNTKRNNEWIKDKNSFINFSDKVGNTIYNVKFLKSDYNEGLYYKTSESANIQEETIVFDNTMTSHSFNNKDELSYSEPFNFPLGASIPLKDIEKLQLIFNKNLLKDSSVKKDILFKSHIEKSFYKKIFLPLSILSLIIFFGSFIFGSLREASPASRIVLSVIGAFIYKVFQDFSISLAISINYSILAGVVVPALILLISSFYLYKKI